MSGPKQQQQSELVNKFNALGDKTRFRLLQLLLEDDGICVIKISNAGVSQQLKIMEQAGILTRKRMGQKICYSVDLNNESNKKLMKLLG